MGNRRHLYPNLCDIGDTRMGCDLQESGPVELVDANVAQTHGVTHNRCVEQLRFHGAPLHALSSS